MRDRFAAGGIDSAALDARLLAELAFGLEGVALSLEENSPVSAAQLARLEALAIDRLAGAPVARLVGSKEFYGLNFALNAATLVPRPETELLVDLGIKALEGKSNARLLDLGTGSGCIAIALLHELPQATCIGVDVSAEALGQAEENARRLGVENRFIGRIGSWFAPIGDDERFDLIVSNPPYIPQAEISGLAVEVRSFDPLLALDGGADGLGPYEEIARGALRHLIPGGMLGVECGRGQAGDLVGLLRKTGFQAVQTHEDLAGIDRVVTGIRP